MLNKIRKIFFVGIGGIGMSGIAEILHHQGYIVSGSDKNLSTVTERLKRLGIKIYEGHSADNIKDVDLVVYTSAVNESNPEVDYAIKRGILTIKRAEMLAECMRGKHSICIAGTHGKTTTTAMMGLSFLEAGTDPTILVGGNLSKLDGGNARVGKGEFIIAEADEFDRTFLKLTPAVAVLNNIEADHLDTYRDIDDIKNAFIDFANKIPFYGFVTLCLDEINLKSIIPQLKRKVLTFGINEEANCRAINISHSEFSSSFTVLLNNKILGDIKLKVPGLFNIKNALATILVTQELGLSFEKVKLALENFSGVQRRFQVKYDKEILVIDDYAHHPTEVYSTLKGIKDGWNNRIIAIFQPHLYSRTRDFYKEFAESFLLADIFICTDIYPAREEPIVGVSGKMIADYAVQLGHKNVIYVKDKNDICAELMNIKKDNDIIITMGAGDINLVLEKFVNSLKKEK